jgi:hypothetical protein
MAKSDDKQLSLDLPQLPKSISAVPSVPSDQPAAPPIKAQVFSLVEKKAASDKTEIARHVSDLLNLVRHFK